MGFSIHGYVLEPPRIGASNSPFTSGPNTFVPQTLLPGLFGTIGIPLQTGFSNVGTTTDLTAILAPGNTIVFLAQLGVTYTIGAVTSSAIFLEEVFTGTFVGGATSGTSSAYCPQIGSGVQAFNTAYPKDESKPRDDYLVLVTSELAPGVGTSYGVGGVTNNGGLIQITSSALVSDGQTVVISGVVGVPANGTWTISIIDSTDFVLNGSTFSGAWTGGGTVLVVQGSPGLLTCAGFGWTKNEIVNRLDYDSRNGRFRTLPGGTIVVAGLLDDTKGPIQLTVPPPFELLADAPFRLSIIPVGAFGSGHTQNVTLVLTDANFTPAPGPPIGTTELSLATGNLNWNSTAGTGDLTTYNGQQISFQQQQYFALGTSTGNIGTFVTLPSTPGVLVNVIMLNPIPAHGQSPLLRIGFLYWLTTNEVPNEGAFTPFPGPPSGTIEWALNTGRLNFSSADVIANPGASVYQDGTLFEKDITLPRTNLGNMPSSGTMGPLALPIPPSGDIIFTIPANTTTNSPYYQFPYYSVVGVLDSGTSGTVEILQGGGSASNVQFSSGDAGAFGGATPPNDVIAVFGDLPIDHGVSIRFYRDPINLDAQTPGVKDVTAVYSVSNAVWASPIMAAPLVFLPSIPVDDATLQVSVGQGTGTFIGSLNPVSDPNPTPGLGFTLDFDSGQLNFAQRFADVLVQMLIPAGYVQLPNPLVQTSNITVALETGPNTNVYAPLTVGVQCLIDGQGGFVYFSTTFGALITLGSSGAFSGTLFTDVTANFVLENVQTGDFLLILTDSNSVATGVYTVLAVASSTSLTVDVPPPHGSGKLGYQILHGKEIMADRFFQPVALQDPGTSVERVTALGPIANATTIVASGGAAFPDQQTLSDPSTDFVAAGVQSGDTITLSPLAGTFGVTHNSPTVTTSVSQVGIVVAGDTLQFTAQPNVSYVVLSVSAGHITLTGNYLGPTNGATTPFGPPAGSTFLVLQATQHTLTPSTDFVQVIACTYMVTRRLQIPTSYIGSVRFRYGQPSTSAPTGVFSTTVVSVTTDADFHAPSSLAQGTVEVSRSTGNLNFAQTDVTAGGTVYLARRLLLNVDYQVNAGLGFIQFQSRLLTNEEVLLTYTQIPPSTTPPTPPGPPIVNERGTFLVRKELVQPHPAPTNTVTFNPTGKQIANNPGPSVWRGGRPQVTNNSLPQEQGQVAINIAATPPTITFLPDSLILNVTAHGPIVQPTENIYIDYYVYQAMGGELSLTVLNPPMMVAIVQIAEGTNSFTIAGNQISQFPTGFLMLVNNAEVYQIGTVTYNATSQQTTITLSSTQEFQSDQTNPPLQVVSGATPLTAVLTTPAYFTMELAPYFTVARGVNTIFIPENKTGIYQTNVILLFTDIASSFTDYYLVTSSTYNPTTNQTQVTLATPAIHQYTFGQQTIFWSVRPIPGAPPTIVHTSRTPITIPQPQPVTVIRRVVGQVGQILTTPVDYSIDATGTVTYASALQPEEEFSIFYTGHRVVTWTGASKGVPGPRLQTSYTATIVPDLATNGLLGQVLNANYTIFSPDNFYYRVESMTNFKLQVSNEIQQAAQSQSSNIGSGPMTSNTTTPVLYQQGNPSVYFPPGDYANHDLIAQACLLFFNNAINDLEDVLHAIDGRIVGDVDGRFLFDAVLGRYDYFSYDFNVPPQYPFIPVQPVPALITNQIDDNIQIYPGPVPTYPDSLTYFQQAYVTGPASRFYQTVRDVFTTNPCNVPAAGNVGTSAGAIVATFNFNNFTALPNTAFKRFPRAQTIFDASYGQNTFIVDDTVGQGTLRPSWTAQIPPSSIIGMGVVVQDEVGSYYVDEDDNATVVGVSSAPPYEITISTIPHDPVGTSGNPPSPPVGPDSGASSNASVIQFTGPPDNLATISLGPNGFGIRSVGQSVNFFGAASPGNNGTFPIAAVDQLLGSIDIVNSGAVAGDANNGNITWTGNYVGFVPRGSTITVSPIDICAAQQEQDGVDSTASGTYNMTYNIGGDVNVDMPTGNVLYQNSYWPFDGNSSFLLPTIFIPQSSYVIPVQGGDVLEMDQVTLSVIDTAPYQFPALFGSILNDDGNQTLPIVGPTFDGEMTEAGGGALYEETTNEAPGSDFRTQITTPPLSTLTGLLTGTLLLGGTRITLASGAFPSNLPLLGVFSVTRGSAIVPTSLSQVGAIASGDTLQFAIQPHVTYTVLSVVGVAPFQITLTTPYTGHDAGFTTGVSVLPGTFKPTRNSINVPTSISQVGSLSPGDVIQFASQAFTNYTVLSVSATPGTGHIKLTAPYSGVTPPTPHTTTATKTLAGVFGVTNSSPTVSSEGTSQVGAISVGGVIQFVEQPGVSHTVLSVSPTTIVLTTNYTGTTSSPTTSEKLQTGPVVFNLVRIVDGANAPGNTQWRRITAVNNTPPASIDVALADAWPNPDTGFHFAMAVSPPNLVAPSLSIASVSGNTLTDSNNPFLGGPITLLGNTYGVMTIVANSSDTSVLDTIVPVVPATASDPSWGQIVPGTGFGASISLGDIVTGPGIDPTAKVTVTQIGPGSNITLSQPTTGGGQSQAVWFIQFTQPPPAAGTVSFTFGTTHTNSITATADSGSGATITVTGPTVTVTGLSGMVRGYVGNSMTISGSSQSTNNGTFPIATFISSSSVTLTNAAAVTDTGGDTWAVGSTITQLNTPLVTLSNLVADALTGTFHVINGNPVVATTLDQTTFVSTNDVIEFASQPGVQYTVLSVIPASITLSSHYLGTTAVATTARLDVTSAVVGALITLSGAANGSNNSPPSFEIVAFLGVTVGPGPDIQISNPAGVAPDAGPITWTIAPSPTIDTIVGGTSDDFMAGLSIGNTVSGALIAAGSTIQVITQVSPGVYALTLDKPALPGAPAPFSVLTVAPPSPWSTTVDSLAQNINSLGGIVQPTAQDPLDVVKGFTEAMNIGPLLVSGAGITYNPELIPPQVTSIVPPVGGSPPGNTTSSFVMSAPATASTLTGNPLAYTNATATATIITVYVPYTCNPGWTVVLLDPPHAGERRQIVSIQSTNTLVLDAALPSPPGTNYRIENPLNTYNGTVFNQLQAAMATEVETISTRTRPAPPPFVYNAQSEQNALMGFFTQVFTTIDPPQWPSTNGTVAGAGPTWLILTDTTVDFLGPDPANPTVTNSDFVYVHLGSSGVQKADEGIYGISNVIDSHHLMVTTNGGATPGFPSPGTGLTYEIVSAFGVSLATLQNIFSIFAENSDFVTATQNFEAALSATVPVLIGGAVDPNIYANGLNDLVDNIGNRYTDVENRLAYLSPTATAGAQTYITAALATSDNLYAKRYAWINARINLQTGYLVLQNTAQATLVANQQAIFNQLIQLLTIQSS